MCLIVECTDFLFNITTSKMKVELFECDERSFGQGNVLNSEALAKGKFKET